MNRHLRLWLEHNTLLQQVKSDELAARLVVIEKVFKAQGIDKAEGTVTYPNDDYLFKAVFRLNYNIADEDKLRQFLSTLPEWQQPRLVKYRPELQLGEYRKLEPRQRNRLKGALLIKPGTPGLSAEPK